MTSFIFKKYVKNSKMLATPIASKKEYSTLTDRGPSGPIPEPEGRAKVSHPYYFFVSVCPPYY